jgi:hypothetical protein
MTTFWRCLDCDWYGAEAFAGSPGARRCLKCASARMEPFHPVWVPPRMVTRLRELAADPEASEADREQARAWLIRAIPTRPIPVK